MNTWSNEKMTATMIHEKIANKTFVVPKYQRGIIWNDQKKNDLIDTIKRGLPFGSILLYADEKNGQYKLIDGLQRCTTVYEFISNPASFFGENDIDEDVIKKITDMTDLINKDNVEDLIKETIIEWIKDAHSTMDQVRGMQYFDCARKIIEMLPSLNGKEIELISIIKPMFSNYQRICQILSETEIPMIIIHGSEEMLPTIFERINSKGSPLTKWQIYAATWSEEKIKIYNKDLKDIVKYNRDRYESLINDDELNIDAFESSEMMNKMELNPFELVYGFGKLISDMYPNLFGNTKRSKDINSIGFNLINACLCLKNNEIKNLNVNMREIVGDDENLNLFLLKLLECIKFVDKSIAITRFKSNARETQPPLHTEMQICSMIASVFINRYMTLNIDYEKDTVENRKIHLDFVNENWKKYSELFSENAIKVYLEDIIQTSWRGSGDRKLNSILLNPTYYTRTVEKNELISILNTWYDQIKMERNEYKKVQNPKEVDKVILNIIYAKILSAKEQLDSSVYDIEHLATKGQMRKQLERFDGALKLPLSSIGNICLLPQGYNREKEDKTIYQHENCLKNIVEIEEKFSFTSEEDMSWIANMTLSQEELKKEYNKFIDKRFEKIKGKIIIALYK